jgi:hypothetical protein
MATTLTHLWPTIEQHLFRLRYDQMLESLISIRCLEIPLEGSTFVCELQSQRHKNGIAVHCLPVGKHPSRLTVGSSRYYLVTPDDAWRHDDRVAF